MELHAHSLRPRLARGASTRWVIFALGAAFFTGLPKLPAAPFDYQIPNGYHAQQTTYYCGPGTMQMILDTPAVLNNYINPVLPSQNALYASAQANNLEPWFTDPNGMAATLNAVDGAFHNYSWYNFNAINAASRTIVNALADYQVPAAALVYGGAHWVNINGFRYTAVPGGYQLNGFYGRDPWPSAGSLGRSFYLAYNPRGWGRVFTPVGYGSAHWGGHYVTVVEPQGPEAPDPGTFDSTPPPPPIIPELNAAGAHQSALNDLAADSQLAAEPGLSGENASQADEILLQYTNDPSNEGDWLVPYENGNGSHGVTGDVLIDADTGVIDQASWYDTPQELSSVEANLQAEYSGQLPLDAIPEPGTLSIVLLGLAGVALRGRLR